MSAFAHRFKQEIWSGTSLIFWAALMLFLALTGPFGTYAAYSFGQRLLVIAPLLLALMVLGVAIRTLVFSTLHPWGFRWACLLNAALASLIIAPILNQFLRHIPTDTITIPGIAELMLLVFSLSMGMASLRSSVSPQLYWPGSAPQTRPEVQLEVGPVPVPPRLARLLQRLETAERGDLWSISVRDHYVDVQTSTGVTSLLMRLSDAMAEADPVEGAQIHRSHWVAWAAVRAVERDGVKLLVVLPGGTRLPVSKNHRDKLAARGLL